MPFFDELPEPPPEPAGSGPVYRDWPWAQPEHWNPAPVAVGAVVGRSADTLVRLDVRDAYPRGLALDVRAWLSPDGEGLEGLHRGFHPHHRRAFVDDLRLGLLWPDGTRVEAGEQQGPEAEVGPALTAAGGGGGGLTWRWHLWLYPLPAPGPVTVYCVWAGRGIEETATGLDLAPAVEAAVLAEELWHLPTVEEAPPEGGWFAYAPIGSYSSFPAQVPEPEGSGDAADAGDEDG
ncbi:MAG: hypothetical protein GC157_16700 [Frankiales bacterium]|nr:hypothetical protein [Frankiales bacterium]